MPLVSDVLVEIATLYSQPAVQDSLNAMVIGKKGSGKSLLARTCRQPVLFHSFDPGGTKPLREYLLTPKTAGFIIADTRFEAEDWKKPTAYRLWEEEVTRLEKAGAFSEVGTYFLDSLTTWSIAAMNEIGRRAGRAGTNPQVQDYLTLVQTLCNYAQLFASWPCDVILTAHSEMQLDEMGSRKEATIFSIGQASKVRIPILFDECYFALPQPKPNGVEYRLLTQNDGTYPASTRIGREKFTAYEPMDIMALRAKAGLLATHLPVPTIRKEETQVNATT